MLNDLSAAGRAAAGDFLLLAQEKVTKEKGNPKAAVFLRFSGKSGLLTNSLAAHNAASLEHWARSLRFSPAMLGGGYGFERQNQIRGSDRITRNVE